MNSNINQQFKSDNKQSVFSDWLVKLKQEGKTDEALMTSLTEEDMKEVEAISGDEAAKKRMEELFTKRAGMSIDQLVQQSQDAFATGYLKAG